MENCCLPDDELFGHRAAAEIDRTHFPTWLEDSVLGSISESKTLFGQQHVVDGQADSWWTNISLFPLFSPIAIVLSAPGEVHQT